MKLIKILVKVIASSLGVLVILWIIAFLYYPQIAPYGQKMNQGRDYRIYFLMGMDVAKESSTQRLITFLNEQYLLKPYHGVRELYFSAWQIIDDDYPAKDIYAIFYPVSYKGSTLIHTQCCFDISLHPLLFNSTTKQIILKNKLNIVSDYPDELGLKIFHNLYFYTSINDKKYQKQRKEFIYEFDFPSRAKKVIFHYYNYGAAYRVDMSDIK